MDNYDIKAALSYGIEKLHDVSDTARLDSEILLSHVIKRDLDKLFFIQHILSDSEQRKYIAFIDERKSLKPIAYLINTKEFWGMDFKVNESVLIPRPDTEIIIESLALLFDKTQKFKFLDLGTGSGCIGITIATNFPNSTGILVDYSSDALEVAKHNSTILNTDSQIKFLQSDWFTKISDTKFDLIVSNPPYISENYTDIESIKHEPKAALFADDNGLLNYKIIAKNTQRFLNPNGYIILEIGFDQASPVTKIFKEFTFVQKIQDFAKNDRVLIFKS